MATNDALRNDSKKQSLFAVLTVISLCLIVPFATLPIRSIGGAVWFSVFLGLFPDALRSRSGSLTPALCLAAFVWLCAAVVVVMPLMGAAEW
jgi:hypothetical protein